MRTYWIRTPDWLPRFFPGNLIWRMPETERAVYLTFDDGPHPQATPFVLDQLMQFQAKASFFCIGKNVVQHPDIYQRILEEGHLAGNHTNNHLNGWHTDNHVYLADIYRAAGVIESRSFRPPYGRMLFSQVRRLSRARRPSKIYIWDELSGDFDTTITPEECLSNVLQNIRRGSIVVFHDSAKAWERLRYTLPEVLRFCQEKGWELRKLPG